jgi:hypothetical protein
LPATIFALELAQALTRADGWEDDLFIWTITVAPVPSNLPLNQVFRCELSGKNQLLPSGSPKNLFNHILRFGDSIQCTECVASLWTIFRLAQKMHFCLLLVSGRMEKANAHGLDLLGSI